MISIRTISPQKCWKTLKKRKLIPRIEIFISSGSKAKSNIKLAFILIHLIFFL